MSWTETDGTTPATPWAFSGLAPGTPSAWQTRYLWNNRAGASPVDPFIEGWLRVLARVMGDTDWRTDGIVALETRGVEVEILGGSAGSGIEPRSPVRIGAGAVLPLPEIPDGEAIYLRARVILPATAGETSLDLDFKPESEPFVVLPTGLWEASGGGIRLGLGDGSVSKVLGGGTPLPAGTPDDTVTIPDLAWVLAGEPFARLTTVETLDDLDGAAAALVAGEAYLALFSLAADGTMTTTKGPKGAEPLGAGAIPATPAGELAYATIIRNFAAEITAGDITLLSPSWGFALRTDGLNVYAGAGEAIVGARFVRTFTESVVAVAPSVDSKVWLLPSGAPDATADGSRPDDRALLLAEVTADGSAVTLLTDRRNFQDERAIRAQFVLPTPAVNDVAYWTNGASSPVYVRPIAPILFALADDPATLAATSGSWKVDLEVLQPDLSWVTLYTNAGSSDRRPSIPFDSTTGRDAASFPEILRIESGQVIRCRVISIAAGGSPASALLLSLLLVPSPG